MSRMWDGGFWTTQSLKGLGPQRRLQDCNIEEVAAHFRLSPTSGMQFDGSRLNKIHARDSIVELFGLQRYPGPISVLSMPGRDWQFESRLLNEREGRRSWRNRVGPRRTEIHAVENDRGVFYDALLRVPGIRNPLNVIRDVGATAYAERVLNYMHVRRFVFADVDDLMQSGETYDCAWLDYFGPLSLERLSIIRRFFDRSVRGTLVLTSLKARWNRRVSATLAQFDGHEAWLRDAFNGAYVEHYIEYFDTSPMVQFAVSKWLAASNENAADAMPIGNRVRA